MGLSALEIAAGLSAAWFAKVILQKYVAVRLVSDSLNVCPGGSIIWQHPFRTLALVTGQFFPPKGWMAYYFAKFSLYQKYGSTCLSSVTFWDALPVFWLSDADAIKTVQTSRGVFPKDLVAYETLNIYGQNMVSAEGLDWKRHRSVANSAFNETNNALVWRETFRVVEEWFSEINSTMESKDEVNVDLLKDLTQVTLLVISCAGFGRRASWKDNSTTEPPPGHKRTFRHAVSSTLEHMITKILIPNWAHDLSTFIHIPFISSYLAETRESFDSLRVHMLDVIGLARDWIASGKTTPMDAGLLRNLVEANMFHEEGGRHLSDDELLSDTFTFLTAGHETSAHTLCFAVLLLALHPDIQQRVYEESYRLWPDDVPGADAPSLYKESMAQLEYTSTVFHETLRLFTPVPRLAKEITADTTLKARRFSTTPDGKVCDVKEYDVLVKAGGLVLIDMLGLHMNPIHWGDDVAEFRPERFIDTDTYRWPRDAFNAFSGGPRSCIGQRFALTESVCILAQLTRKYEICIPNELKGKSFAEQKEIMLEWKPGITMTPTNANVVFRRRT